MTAILLGPSPSLGNVRNKASPARAHMAAVIAAAIAAVLLGGSAAASPISDQSRESR